MKKNIVILGSGITGLVTALKLSDKFSVYIIEKKNEIGGMSTSFKYKNFILDYGPHKLYTQIPGIIEDIKKVCSLLKIKKKNSIYLKGNYFDFPLSIKQIALKMPIKTFQAALDIFSKFLNKLPDDSYENFLINRFGKTLYALSFRDYAQKVWNSNPLELDCELAKRRISVSSIFELIKSILLKKSEKISADYFYYPPNGLKQLIDSLTRKTKENKVKILTNSKIREIKIKENKVIYIKTENKIIKSDFLISTIPLKNFIFLIKNNLPEDILKAAQNLVYQDSNMVYFIINKPKVLKDNWVFFPELKFLFHRVSEQKSFSPYTCPKEKTALIVETTKPTTKENIEKIKQQLISINLIKEKEIEEIFLKKLENAYPVYTRGFKKNLDLVLEYLDQIENFLTLGRHGLFNYNNIDQCWDMAKKAAEHIKENRSKEEWIKLRKYFDNYKIID